MPAATTMTFAASKASRASKIRCSPATPTSYRVSTRLPRIAAVTAELVQRLGGVDFLAGEEVAHLRAHLGIGEGVFGRLQHELVDFELAAVVVDDVERPELPEGDGPGPRNVIPGRLARRDEDPQGQAGEVVARQEPFGREVAVGIEVSLVEARSLRQQPDLAFGLGPQTA